MKEHERNAPYAAVAVIALLLCATAAFAGNQTIIVTSTSDAVDFGGGQQIDDLPGPNGTVSLREAVIAANNTPGSQTIVFNIPGSDPEFNGSVFQIRFGSALTLTDDGTTIDGFSQAGFTGDTNPTGSEISLFGQIPVSLSNPALRINSSGNVVQGLGGFNFFRYGIEINGNANTIAGVQIVQALSAAIHINGDENVLDGTMSEVQNRFSSGGVGVWVRSGGSSNQVIGNLIQSNHGDGVNLEGNGNIVGGPMPAQRNIINTNGHTNSEGTPVGAQVSIDGNGNVVLGNYLGVDATGLLDSSGSARDGVFITGSDTVVGGPDPGAGNVIAGHGAANFATRHGVLITGGTGNVVQGNLIGVGADGVTPIPNERNLTLDVFLFNNVPVDTLIGGEDPGAGNTIAHSIGYGLGVLGFGSSNPDGITIRGNSFFSNSGPAIDLAGDGVTPNDTGDPDGGPNRRQNFPVQTSATVSGSSMIIEGGLNSLPGEMFAIELFSSGSCDPTGHGEGETPLGHVVVATDGSGSASFVAELPFEGDEPAFVTATATRESTGDTSEFSACLDVVFMGGIPGDVNGDGVVNVSDLVAVIVAWGTTDADADVNGDGTVNVLDLVMVITNWS